MIKARRTHVAISVFVATIQATGLIASVERASEQLLKGFLVHQGMTGNGRGLTQFEPWFKLRLTQTLMFQCVISCPS